MEQKEVFLTEAGLLKIEEELKRLKTTEREEIAARIKLAKSYGDLSENGEYDEAKSAQEANETRIAELEYMISQAKIIDESEINTDTVAVGNTVYITNISNNKEQKYTIVGTTESNILQGKISNESPIAKSLLGAKVGDIVQVEAPAGIIEYKIKKITLE
ncbi:MAG: transcription elongation factor GreA [Clostridiales bacterium]|nr:transcription elongation factor GreA [Clostridiales bacterium]